MDLRSTQIKDTYGNLVTIGSTAGTPTTGTLQNGQGSDLTSLTINGAAVFNEGGGNFDFRVEGDTEQNLFFVDASTDRVGIGTSSLSDTFTISASNPVMRIVDTDGGYHQILGNAGILGFRADHGNAVANSLITFSIDGSEMARITSAGNMGIGTSAPTAKLTVDGSAVFNESGADVDFRVEGDTDANLLFIDASTNRVGIGTNAPTVKLQVEGFTIFNGASVFNESGADVDFRIESDTNANMFFVDAGQSRVGIGTNAPGAIFGVSKSSTYATENSAGVKITDETADVALLLGADNAVDAGYIQTVHPFTSFSTRDLALQPQGGDVVIGGDTANAKLDVRGSAIFNENGADVDFRVEGDTDANLLFIDASADKVGIGTSAPDALLTVDGVASFGDGAVGTPSIANAGDLDTGLWFPAANTLAASTGGAEALRVDSGGALLVGRTSSITGIGSGGIVADDVFAMGNGWQRKIFSQGTISSGNAGGNVVFTIDGGGSRSLHMKITFSHGTNNQGATNQRFVVVYLTLWPSSGVVSNDTVIYENVAASYTTDFAWAYVSGETSTLTYTNPLATITVNNITATFEFFCVNNPTVTASYT